MLKKTLQVGVLLSPLFFSVYATATTLDYRHEYLNDDEQHADRLRVSHRFDNKISFALEAKWSSNKSGGESHMYDNLVSKGAEFELGYLYPVNNQFSLSPAVIIDSNSDSTTYKFQVKGEYKFTPELSVSARYRYGVKDYERSKNKDSQHFHQGNFAIAYKFEHFNLSYDFEIKKTDYPAWKGKERDYAHNVVVQVPVNKEWVPFAELGYVPYKSTSSTYKEDWQWRYRVGVKYNF